MLGEDVIGYCEEKISNEHGSNSLWLPRENCKNLQTELRFRVLFVVLDEERSLQKKGWVHQTNRSLAVWILLLA